MPEVAGIDVSRETYEALKAFEALTLKWTPHINLIAKSTLGQIWERHIIDSVQIYRHAPSFTHWVDIGSGGGFPGVVVAILGKEASPDSQFTLIESDTRKGTFLRTAIRELSLNAKVIADRIEDTPPQNADVVSARALGPLSTLIPLVHRHLSSTGTALLMKGRRYAEELHDVEGDWTFDLAQYPSITEPDSRTLSLQRISRVA